MKTVAASKVAEKSGNAEQKRQELAAVAYAVIAEKGFEGLRVRDVASRAGINVATLHYYFPTKEIIVQAVVQYLTEQFASRNSSPAELERKDPLLMLRQEFSNLAYRLQNLPHLFIVAAELELHALREPTIAPILRQMYDTWHEHLTTILQLGLASGTFRNDLDIPTSATAIMTLMKGFSYQAGSEPDNEVAKLARQVEKWLTL